MVTGCYFISSFLVFYYALDFVVVWISMRVSLNLITAIVERSEFYIRKLYMVCWLILSRVQLIVMHRYATLHICLIVDCCFLMSGIRLFSGYMDKR